VDGGFAFPILKLGHGEWPCVPFLDAALQQEISGFLPHEAV
jgi:hypothetical protein